MNAAFWKQPVLIGMVHLPALPGSPLYAGQPMEAILEQARADACALAQGGADAVMVENFFDAPFPKENSPPHTLVAMTRAVQAVREAIALPLGVNVLRNDVCAALAIAHLTGAEFVRCNVYVGAAVTDQGIIEGAARNAIRYRRELGAKVALWADVFVKHATPLGTGTLEDAARDAVERGRADALIVSGTATGLPTSPEDVRRVREAVPSVPVLVGSGFQAETAQALLPFANGAIVGTALKQNSIVSAPVDPERVRQLRAKMDALNS